MSTQPYVTCRGSKFCYEIGNTAEKKRQEVSRKNNVEIFLELLYLPAGSIFHFKSWTMLPWFFLTTYLFLLIAFLKTACKTIKVKFYCFLKKGLSVNNFFFLTKNLQVSAIMKLETANLIICRWMCAFFNTCRKKQRYKNEQLSNLHIHMMCTTTFLSRLRIKHYKELRLGIHQQVSCSKNSFSKTPVSNQLIYI